jgi:FixJ family two-component response regulator
MSAAAKRRHGFRIEELLPPSVAYEKLKSEPLGQRLLDAFEERLRDNTQTPVIDQVVFRLDFRDWLGTLSTRNRQVVDQLMAGEGTGEVARKLGLSAGRVSQLRRQFEDEWAVFCYDPALA